MRYSAWVTFSIHAKDIDSFTERITLQGRHWRDLVPGCLGFEVWITSMEPRQVVLYECYESQQAYAEHLASAHYLAFDKEVASMVKSKSIVTCDEKNLHWINRSSA